MYSKPEQLYHKYLSYANVLTPFENLLSIIIGKTFSAMAVSAIAMFVLVVAVALVVFAITAITAIASAVALARSL